MVAMAVTIFHHEEQGGSYCPYPCRPSCDPVEDVRCLTTTFHYLQTSGWYWGSISASEAREALLTKPVGTFLIRDSSHPQYMLALSVKTSCGPTSVRIVYSHSRFWLESISPCLFDLRSFPDVLSLIQYYKSAGEKPRDETCKTIPNSALPTIIDSGVPLKLRHPLHTPKALPSLQHLVRLTINRHANCSDQLPLPKPLLRYLQDYPFHI
ncbi:hypothetical protein INR49_029596 [Caranx melampygus]|nr:hypothetical protein INR49_029596 [Caranx melampygus]